MTSGVAVAVTMTPFDVISTRLYNQPVDESHKVFVSSLFEPSRSSSSDGRTPTSIQPPCLSGPSVPKLLRLHAEGVPGRRRAGLVQRHGSGLCPPGSSHDAQHAVLGSDETTSSEERQEEAESTSGGRSVKEEVLFFVMGHKLGVHVKVQLDSVHPEDLNPPTSSPAAHYSPVTLTSRPPAGSNFVTFAAGESCFYPLLPCLC